MDPAADLHGRDGTQAGALSRRALAFCEGEASTTNTAIDIAGKSRPVPRDRNRGVGRPAVGAQPDSAGCAKALSASLGVDSASRPQGPMISSSVLACALVVFMT